MEFRLLAVFVVLGALASFLSCTEGDIDALQEAKRYDRESRKYLHDRKKQQELLLLAVQEYSKAIESASLSQKQREQAHLDRGGLNLELDKCDRALGDFRETIVLNRNNATAHYLSALCQVKLGRLRDAIEAYDYAIKLDPSLPDVFAGRGLVYMKMAEYKLAIDDFSENIRRMSPYPNVDSFEWRGDSYVSDGQFGRAVDDYLAAIEISEKHVRASRETYLPREAELYVKLGNAQVATGAYCTAERSYKKAIDVNSLSDRAHHALAQLYLHAKDSRFRNNNKGLKHAQKAVELTQKKDPEALRILAEAYFLQGKNECAIKIQREALSLRPDDQSMKDALSRFHAAHVGRNSKAYCAE